LPVLVGYVYRPVSTPVERGGDVGVVFGPRLAVVAGRCARCGRQSSNGRFRMGVFMDSFSSIKAEIIWLEKQTELIREIIEEMKRGDYE